PGSREAATWMRKLWVVSVALLSGCVLAACGGGSSNNSTRTNGGSTAGKGGTYKVGWEQAFSFTNNFDPTGEDLGDANHLLQPARPDARRVQPRSGPGRQQARARHRHGGAEADERRQDLSLHTQEGDPLRAAGRPRRHLDTT